MLFPVDENNFEADNWHALAYLDITSKYSTLDIDREKWNLLSYYDKIYCSLERIYAITSDQFLIKYRTFTLI